MNGALKREAMRKSSVEVQQLATWKEQQTLQEIQNLKMLGSSLNKPDKSAENSPMNKLSKFAARKQRAESGHLQSSSLNFDHLQNDHEYHNKPRHVDFHVNSPASSTVNSTSPFPPVTAMITEQNNEVDILLQEKKYFLSRLNEDNEKMVQLLEDLQTCKANLTLSIESVETERDRLKGYQVDLSSQCIDEFLIDSTGGALSGLMAYQHSEAFQRMIYEEQDERIRNAEELQSELLALVAKHKANQHEQNEYIFSRIQDIATLFLHNNHATVDTLADDLTRLRTVIEAASAKNLYTVDNVAQALTNALVELTVTSKPVVAAAQHVLIKDPSKSAAKQAESQNLNSSGRFSGLSANTVTQSELDALVAQNENLKSSLEKLRKNTAQLRGHAAQNHVQSAASNKKTTPKERRLSGEKIGQSSSNNASNKSGGVGVGGGGGGGGTGSNVLNADGSPFDDTISENGGEEETKSVDLDRASGSFSPGLEKLLESKVESPLPDIVTDSLQKHLNSHIQGLLEKHPITTAGMPVDILQETAKEITQQVLPVATTALKAYLIHVGKIPDISTVEGIRTCTDIRSVQDVDVRRAVEDGTVHTTQVVAVHKEIASLATLYLTYLYKRLGLTLPTPPPPSAAVAAQTPASAPTAPVMIRSMPHRQQQSQQQQQPLPHASLKPTPQQTLAEALASKQSFNSGNGGSTVGGGGSSNASVSGSVVSERDVSDYDYTAAANATSAAASAAKTAPHNSTTEDDTKDDYSFLRGRGGNADGGGGSVTGSEASMPQEYNPGGRNNASHHQQQPPPRYMLPKTKSAGGASTMSTPVR